MQDLLPQETVSNETKSLNDLYADYAAGILKKKEFEGAIFNALRKDMPQFCQPGWSKEDYEDYISSLYPRISRSIDTYQDTGANFEKYIGSIVRLSAKEFHFRRIRSYNEETAAWIAHIPDIYASDHAAEYHEYAAEETEETEKLKNPRQLLILILKCCNHVSIEFLGKISPRLGMKPAELNNLIDQLKQQREKREMDYIALQERANCQFYRCILLEKKLQSLPHDSPAIRQIKEQLERKRDRLAFTRQRIARMQRDPSNHQIAKLLGISKGTVDTVLYKLKARSVQQDQSSKNNLMAADENPSFLSV